MEISTIGFDLAESVFQVHAVDAAGLVVLQRRLRRSAVKAFFAQLPPCLVAMEACGSAHYWARELSGLGHRVKLLPPSEGTDGVWATAVAVVSAKAATMGKRFMERV